MRTRYHIFSNHLGTSDAGMEDYQGYMTPEEVADYIADHKGVWVDVANVGAGGKLEYVARYPFWPSFAHDDEPIFVVGADGQNDHTTILNLLIDQIRKDDKRER